MSISERIKEVQSYSIESSKHNTFFVIFLLPVTDASDVSLDLSFQTHDSTANNVK